MICTIREIQVALNNAIHADKCDSRSSIQIAQLVLQYCWGAFLFLVTVFYLRNIKLDKVRLVKKRNSRNATRHTLFDYSINLLYSSETGGQTLTHSLFMRLIGLYHCLKHRLYAVPCGS